MQGHEAKLDELTHEKRKPESYLWRKHSRHIPHHISPMPRRPFVVPEILNPTGARRRPVAVTRSLDQVRRRSPQTALPLSPGSERLVHLWRWE